MHSVPGRSNAARSAVRLAVMAGLALGVSAGARADFSITGSYTPTPAGFVYNLSVNNSGPDDLLLATFFQTGLLTTIDQTSAPAGFQTTPSSDGASTFVDFSPSSGSSSVFAAGGTVSGFRFRSSSLFDAPEVGALDINGGAPTGTFSVIAQAAPEPASLALFAPVLFAGIVLARRRKAP